MRSSFLNLCAGSTNQRDVQRQSPLVLPRTGCVAALMAVTLYIAQAADDPATFADGKRYLPWEKGFVRFGGFITAFNSDLGFGINNAGSIKINAEDVFGLDSSLTVLRGDIMYRPGESLRHQLELSYASYHRDGSASVREEFVIDGITVPVGAEIDSIFNFDIIRGTYSYALLQSERARVALGLGVYAIPLEYGVDIQTGGGRNAVEGADTTFPLPSVALRGEFQFIPRLFLNLSVDAMYLEISDFRGALVDGSVGLEYRPWKHFGLGLGYSGMLVEVESENASSSYPGADFVGTVDVQFNGLLLYGKWSF